MRVQVMSDLHLEFHKDLGEEFIKTVPVEGDVLVLAGDCFSTPHRGRHLEFFEMFQERFAGCHITYVPGNHDFYFASIPAIKKELREAALKTDRFHVLERSSVLILSGIRFVGSTLWFPNEFGRDIAKNHMTDFQVISDFDTVVNGEHEKDLKALEVVAKSRSSRKTVCITHHLPHPNSVHPQYKGNLLNKFFLAEDAAPLVESCKFDLWVHGHTHSFCDYMFIKHTSAYTDHPPTTRVVCNPGGYPHECNYFDPAFSVEI